MPKFICFCFAVTVLAVKNVGIVQQAQARSKPEYADSPYREWFARQRSSEGRSCCELSDAHPVYDAYVKEGKWYVPIDGVNHEIRSHQLLSGRNPTGHAVVWYKRAGNYILIYCFAPGPLY
jgi:hypothetical protein